jgi:pantothenate kinase
MKYVMEMTPNQIEYQISPDTFSEVNHPVELLQWYQTKQYIEELYQHYLHDRDSPSSLEHDAVSAQQQQQFQPILIVSGRDISSFALGFGTLFAIPPEPAPPTTTTLPDATEQTEHPTAPQQYMFQHVIAIQHCPLVHYDAVQNIQRYEEQQQRRQTQEQQPANEFTPKDPIVVGQCPTFSVYHCTKATMVYAFQQELCKESTKHIPVFGVMTGGRKGLDVSYVKFLNEHIPIQGIVYNSCATKSLLRDMSGFMLRGPYYLDHFRSYDFLPNTPYTASLTKLMRRPRTLIILIGPAGVGKSTMVKQLLRQYSANEAPQTESTINNITWWERDRIFTEFRNQGVSLAKTKALVHASLLNVLRRRDDNIEDENVAQRDDNSAVIIIDSTNGNAEGRQLYVKEAKPEVVIYVHFQINQSNDEDVIEYLLDCTKYRLNNNTDQHPSFPQSIEAQRMKHRNILSGMEDPSQKELKQIERDNFPTLQRTVLLTCDPRSTQSRSQLPYKVFLEYSTSPQIRNAITE